jgi:glycosyltransferase involved in cell wall biosynthesis
MGKIKVLQVISSSNIGGAEKLFCSLLKYLDKDKFEAYVACSPNGPMFKNFVKHAEEIKTFNFNSRLLKPLTIFSLGKYMRRKGIDIVHTHLFNADLLGAITASFARIPYKIATVHGYNFSNTGEFDLRSIKNFFFSFIYRFTYLFCDNVIAVCQPIKQDLTGRAGIKVKEGKIKVINSAIDLEEISNCNRDVNSNIKDIMADKNTKFVGIIANLDKVKCHRILLRAIPRILKEEAKTKFLLVGDGKEKRFLQRMAGRLKIEDSVVFLGLVEHVTGIISMCDLIVLPSLFESRPLVIAESMALRKAVIAARVGGIPELVEDGVTGLLVPPGNSEKLAEAILRLLKNKELTLEMGGRGQIKVQELFGLRNMVREIEKTYLELVKER